jgi:hypothetical protein
MTNTHLLLKPTKDEKTFAPLREVISEDDYESKNH